MVNQGEYVDGLERFIDKSEEDRIDVDGVLSQFHMYTPDIMRRNETRILDIGSGNGQKALYLAQKLKDIGISTKIDFLEPKEEQRKRLAETCRKINYDGKVYPITLGELSLQRNYDIALLIHSLYEFPRNKDGTIQTLEKLAECLNEDGMGIIVMEHPAGDFQKMKRDLYPKFGKDAPVSQEIVEKTLRKAKIPYHLGEIINFNFPVGELLGVSNEEIGQSLSFLFSDSLKNGKLTKERYQLVGKWIRQNVRGEKGSEYLWTPDVVLWARTR